jgi:hypothetical protein
MTTPQRLPGGKIRALAPLTETLPDGTEVTGDAVLDLSPGDPGYADAEAWLAYNQPDTETTEPS